MTGKSSTDVMFLLMKQFHDNLALRVVTKSSPLSPKQRQLLQLIRELKSKHATSLNQAALNFGKFP